MSEELSQAVVLSIQIVHIQVRKPVVSVELMLCRYNSSTVHVPSFFCFFLGGFLLSPFWLVAAFFVGCFLFLVANVKHEENGVVKSSRFTFARNELTLRISIFSELCYLSYLASCLSFLLALVLDQS